MLSSSDSRLVNRLVVLVADIKDHYGTIVATSSNKGGFIRMEVNSHNTRLSSELILGPGEILDGVAADETTLGV